MSEFSQVDTKEISSIAGEVKKSLGDIQNYYDQIKNNFSQIKEKINTVNSYNGKEVAVEQDILSKIFFKSYVNVTDNLSSLIDEGEQVFEKAVADNINSYYLEANNLDQVSQEIGNFVTVIEDLLDVEYTGSIKTFFENLDYDPETKEPNPAWMEYKAVAKVAEKLKTTDELYLYYRSQEGKSDYVDALLDEIGNGRFASLNSTDDGSMAAKGPTKYGEYIKAYADSLNGINLKAMTDDEAFCAAAVTYAINMAGGGDGMDGYIGVSAGKSSAKASAEAGKGTFHSGTDENYTPQRGDIFYYIGEAGEGHTGIVLDSQDGELYTIEANTKGDSYGNYAYNEKGEVFEYQNESELKDSDKKVNLISDYGRVNTRIRDNDYVKQCSFYTPDIYRNETVSSGAKLSADYVEMKKDVNVQAQQNGGDRN